MAIKKNTNYMTIQNKKTVNQVFKEAGFFVENLLFLWEMDYIEKC